MVPENLIAEFVKRIRQSGGANIESVILFGSAASGDFRSGLSNLNMLCILHDSSFAALQSLAPAAKWWDRQKQPPPLCMTYHELQHSTDVFTIELLDMQQHNRILFGKDVLENLEIPMELHRVQVEYELREKIVLLRQQSLLATDSDSRLWALLLRSLPSFVTLFRHALIALGDPVRTGGREAIDILSKRIGFDPAPIHKAMDVRDHKINAKKIAIKELFGHYLATIEKVTATVDKALDSNAPGRV